MADTAICWDDGSRVKWAIANIVEMGSGWVQFIRQLSMQTLNITLPVEAPRDPGLVGDDKSEQPTIVQRLDCRSRAVDPTETFK